MRSGGRHKDKRSKAEKKQVTRREPVSHKGPAILESDPEHKEEEMYRKIVEDVSERNALKLNRGCNTG